MADEQRDTGSLLGSGSDFQGKLTFLGTVRIEGRIEGDIYSDDTLVVAKGGEVRGTVEVGTLIITGGLVDARVIATKAVEIHPDGRLNGDVTTPIIQVERGAIFRGTCNIPEENVGLNLNIETEDPI
ncbi:MAG: polymer-forming cytoskeletal protein [Myxococcota bacterium]|nr:polymer-forming cytoskeletal protein [Myxococcota bacterium]